MKQIGRSIVVIIFIQIVVLSIIVGTAKIQDVTLATDAIWKYNEGWSMSYDNGSVERISKMPYFGKAAENEEVIASNTITSEICGETIFFLAADKILQIFVDDDMIYSFGMDDEKRIGHAPGSVMVFADIPEDAEGKSIQIKMSSPYKDFATYMTDIMVGDRDVAILYFLKDKMFVFICCFGILVCGIVILIMATAMKYINQKATKMYCIGFYIIIQFMYYMIETKMPMIFWGNQFMYSNLVFVCLMTTPLFMEMYLYSSMGLYKKGMWILMMVTTFNIVAQLVLQQLNIKDFLEMSFISHGLYGVVIGFALMMEFEKIKANKKLSIDFFEILVLVICGAADIVRYYISKVGDFGKYGRIGLLIFSICLIVSNLREMIQRQIEMAEAEKEEVFSAEIIRTLVTAIDAKDIYTKGHSTRVAEYSVILAKALGWDEERVSKVRYKAMLHDVGKIGIPDRVLNKADRLSDEEFEIIKSHTTIGAEILQGVSNLSDMYLVARNHHERFDGRGYPDKLSGNDIPIEARLVGIVDAYDAMSSNRAYRKALPKEVIRNELIKGRGSQFDPEMTDAFLEIFESGKLDKVQNESEAREEAINVASVVNEMISNDCEPGAIKIDQDEMGKVYQYIAGLHSRYGMDFNSVLISLEWEADVTMDDVAQAMKAMEYSILQSLRSVDVTTRISESQYLILLTEAHSQNLRMIIDRVFSSFYSNCQNTKIKPVYEINSDGKSI